MVAQKVTSRHYKLRRVLKRWDTALSEMARLYDEGATLIEIRDVIMQKTGIKVDPTTILQWIKKGMAEGKDE